MAERILLFYLCFGQFLCKYPMKLPVTRRQLRPVKLAIVSVISLLFCAGTVLAQAPEVARLDSAEGTVEAKLGSDKDLKPIQIGTIFHPGDVIRTGKGGRAGIIFSDGVLLRLADNSTLQFQAPSGGDPAKTPVAMDSGKAYFFSRTNQELPFINTPAVSTAIRGTEFGIEATSTTTIVTVINGLVECKNQYGSVTLSRNEQSVTEKGHAPSKAILLRPQDAVQWALYYPSLPASSDSDLLNKISTLLSHGQVKEAEELLKRADNLSGLPTGDSYKSQLQALHAIIALANNRKEDASRFADAATQGEYSAAGAVAKAYVSQAQFDLDATRLWLLKAIEKAPSNAFLHARFAEVYLGFGELRDAEKEVAQALELDPTDSYALSVLGFTKLIRNETDEAETAFRKAVTSDSGLALPRLGLGLVSIRRGRLEDGRKSIEQAAFLDPAVSLYRSYLGKAFFEQEKEDKAAQEYEEAIALDPLDPTPYLYRAYNELSKNRPVDALRDIEKSIDLNNNRAVYRSRLLLDQDVAVRSAGLAEVFNTLGFSEIARVEAIKSLNRDYSNYSAHRLLSEGYRSILLNDASISEDAIAKLLSPLSFNLFQRPAGEVSLNDYNALFDRSQIRTGVDLTYNRRDDLFSQAVYNTGKFDTFGYLVGVDSTITGGSKVNEYYRFHRARGALQFQPSYENRFLLDASGLYSRNSDEEADFNESRFLDGDVNLGYQRRIDANSRFLGRLSYGSQKHDFTDNDAFRSAILNEVAGGQLFQSDLELLLNEFSRDKVKFFRGEGQYILDTDLASVVAGSQLYYSDIDRRETSLVLEDSAGLYPGLGYYLRSRGENTLNSYAFYLYSSVHLTPWMDLNVGGNFTELDLEDLDIPPFGGTTRTRSKFSPKAGLTFYPAADTLIRLAYFETLRKSSFEDTLAIEPTLVSGINQRFTDLSGAEARNFGAGIDQKLFNSTYFGVEALHRHLIESFNDVASVANVDYDSLTQSFGVAPGEFIEDHQDRDSVRGYVYQVLSDSFVASLEHEWSYFTHTAPSDVDYNRIALNRSSLGLRYFSTTGIFAEAVVTRRNQDRLGSFLGTGDDTFWIADAKLGYRLPKRHGIVAIQVTNLFDKDFLYDQSLGIEEPVYSDLGIAAVASFNF
jgi:Flp pilus assembly protein TadD